jgi:hypothetical protein
MASRKHGGTGANLRLPLNPPGFESFVPYDVTTGPGTLTTGFTDLEAARYAFGAGAGVDPNLRPQFAAVERLR